MATISELFERARVAQAKYELMADQAMVDSAVRAIGKLLYDRAEEFAQLAVDETGFGVYEDTVAKNKGKAKTIWNSLKGKKSCGILEENKETGIIKIAKPMGVVGAVTPTTNPSVTPMCNAMFALKGKNAIVFAPHPRVNYMNKKLIDYFRAELAKLGLPEDLIQTIESPSLEDTQELMKAADIVVATGGDKMVKAAYSCGKPAVGVGPGNVQVIIDRGIDYEAAVKKVITGRTFDNGIICSGEQCAIIPSDKYDEVINLFVKNGTYYSEDPIILEKFAKALFSNGVFKREAVGRDALYIAEIAGVDVPDNTRMILLKARGIGTADVLCNEKMCNVMSAIPYDTFEDALRIADANLHYEGLGHTCVIHSDDMEHIKQAGLRLPVSRIVVNQSSSTGAGGSLYNGFSPTTTLGCGSWGNNSISENLNYMHLINVTQLGLYNKDAVIPTDEEIWA